MDLNQKLPQLKEWYHQQRAAKPKLFKGLKYALWAALAGVLLLFVFVLSVYWGAFGNLPTYAELREIQNHTASQVYSEDGVVMGKYYQRENRVNADFGEIAPEVLQALVATEDARFFEHDGIDLRAVIRVFLRTILMQDESGGGGSTLSQQLAKNLFKRQDKGIFTIPVAKVREMFIARRLEKLYEKEELLNLYLNTVPFGGNIYGIKVASQRFFNTSPKYLKLEQAAVLVGMLKANTYYDPNRNPENALARRNTVLHQMEKYKYLTKVEKDSLQKLPLQLDFHPESNNKGLATYFREHLRQELKDVLKEHQKPDGSIYNIYTDGLRIYTTIDSRLQGYAERSVGQQMKKLQALFDNHWKGDQPFDNQTLTAAKKLSRRYKGLKKKGMSDKEIDAAFAEKRLMTIFDWKEGTAEKELSPLDSIQYYLTLLNAGFFAMDPQSGKVRAWVGGIDHQYFQYDHVKSTRQAGSIFKPIVYTAALQAGVAPCNYVDNFLTTYTDYEDWRPENADGKYGGVYSMEGGLSKSVNTVAVDMIMRTGVDSVIQLAKTLGVSTDIPQVPSIALGVADVSLFDMIQVYSAFANGGYRVRPKYLSRIETADGRVIVDFERAQDETLEQVLHPDEVAIINRILQTAVNEGTGTRLRSEFGLWNEIAGKTGTTQNQSDGWFIGYTPKLVAGAWVGGEFPQIHFRDLSLGQGAKMALPIWGQFYQTLLKDKEFQNWQGASFPPLSDSLVVALDCERYLEQRPGTIDTLSNDGRGIWDDVLGIFRKEKRDSVQADASIKKRERRTNKSQSDRSREIERRNKKLERKRTKKKKRKKFWDKVFKKRN